MSDEWFVYVAVLQPGDRCAGLGFRAEGPKGRMSGKGVRRDKAALSVAVSQSGLPRDGKLCPSTAPLCQGVGARPAYAAICRRFSKCRNSPSDQSMAANSGPMPLMSSGGTTKSPLGRRPSTSRANRKAGRRDEVSRIDEHDLVALITSTENMRPRWQAGTLSPKRR